MFCPPLQHQKIVARLVFDAFLPRPSLAIRSMSPPIAGRQMLFLSDGYYVALRVEPVEQFVTMFIVGQIASATCARPDVAGWIVRLVPQGRGSNTGEELCAETDARGMFRFRDLPVGDYDLVINVPDAELWLKDSAYRFDSGKG